jgi:mannose-6-phosphate isomerase-like protein (cupin superfamily)
LKRYLALAVFLTSAVALHAADPEGFALWKGSMVRNAGKDLSGKVDDQKFAWQSLGTYDNHLTGISFRAADGGAELHETQTDILIVEAGEATLTVGGKMVAPKTVKPHEVRGTSIDGGEIKKLVPGDIMHIPANVPHQLKVPAGKTLTYFVIKVDSK